MPDSTAARTSARISSLAQQITVRMATNGHSESPVAIITGGASGMGLSVTERLLELGWNVMILDFNEEAAKKVSERLGGKTAYIKVDTGDYESQAKAFVETWKKWSRLDFVFANAGHGDRINFYETAEEREDGSPPKPDMAVVDSCLNGVIYSAYLALHYFRKNANKSGKLVSTSSMCGLYSGDGIPLYTAAKHGVVGFTRALAGRLKTLGEPITVNCLCPGLVVTGLTEQTLVPFAEQEVITPHSTILRAVEGFLNDDTKTGLAAECSTTNINYHSQPEFGDEAARQLWTTNWAQKSKDKMAASAQTS